MNDNLAQKAKSVEILSGGAKALDHKWDLLKINALADRLTKLGYPTKSSTEAGQYLCEEMLYQLLHFQKENQSKNSTKLESVFFVHVPILGHLLEIDGKQKAVDQSYLLGFGEALVATLGEMGVFADLRILE
jgi:pyroglutamyl-peptidase